MLRKHYESKKQTVLISPSLHLGVDLKDDLSRFQVIVKVPYPDLTDKKITAKRTVTQSGILGTRFYDSFRLTAGAFEVATTMQQPTS